jgi:hypothetical protein
MTGWTDHELGAVGAAEELEIAIRGADGTLRRPVPIWVVRVGDGLYVRSWRGVDGRWQQAAQASGEARISAGGVDRDVALLAADEGVNDAVDAGYRAKYGRYASYVAPMLAAPARATTLALAPREGSGRRA